MGKKRKQGQRMRASSAKSVKGSANSAAVTQRRILPVIIAAIAIIVVVAVLWAVKGFAESSDAEVSAGSDAPASAAANTAPASDVWGLDAKSVDMDAIAEANVPAVIDFGSDSCVPCKQMAPVLKKSNEEMQGRAIVKFVDVWKYTDAADGFPVQVIPTQVLMMPGGVPYEPSEELTARYGIQFSQYADSSGNLAFTTHQGALTQEQMDAILEDMGA